MNDRTTANHVWRSSTNPTVEGVLSGPKCPSKRHGYLQLGADPSWGTQEGGVSGPDPKLATSPDLPTILRGDSFVLRIS